MNNIDTITTTDGTKTTHIWEILEIMPVAIAATTIEQIGAVRIV